MTGKEREVYEALLAVYDAAVILAGVRRSGGGIVVPEWQFANIQRAAEAAMELIEGVTL